MNEACFVCVSLCSGACVCATGSRVCYSVVPALGLEIYYLGYGANRDT